MTTSSAASSGAMRASDYLKLAALLPLLAFIYTGFAIVTIALMISGMPFSDSLVLGVVAHLVGGVVCYMLVAITGGLTD